MGTTKYFIDSDIRWPSQHNNDIIISEDNIECLIKWVDIGERYEAPLFRIFDNYWSALPKSELLKALSEIEADGLSTTTKEQVKAVLKAHGFEDWTERYGD